MGAKGIMRKIRPTLADILSARKFFAGALAPARLMGAASVGRVAGPGGFLKAGNGVATGSVQVGGRARNDRLRNPRASTGCAGRVCADWRHGADSRRRGGHQTAETERESDWSSGSNGAFLFSVVEERRGHGNGIVQHDCGRARDAD